MRSSVDLPAPFAPTRPVLPPVSSSVTWLSASTVPYHLETCSKRRSGSVSDGERGALDPRAWAGAGGSGGVSLGGLTPPARRVSARNSEFRMPHPELRDDL